MLGLFYFFFVCVCVRVCVLIVTNIVSVAVVGVEGFAKQLAWATQALQSLPLANHPSLQAFIPEEEGGADMQGSSEDGPYFVSPPLSNVSTRVGRPAVLTCVVKHLGSRQVGGAENKVDRKLESMSPHL